MWLTQGRISPTWCLDAIENLLTAKITFGQNPGPKMSSNSRIMLFRLLVNLGSCEITTNTNKIQNKHTNLPIFSRPVHWRGWRRRWRAWSPPSTSSPTASPSRGRSARRLPSLALSILFADLLQYSRLCWFYLLADETISDWNLENQIFREGK